MAGQPERPVFCLHPATSSPRARWQTCRPSRDIQQLKTGSETISARLKATDNPGDHEISPKIKQIEKLINDAGPVEEKPLKPFIRIDPYRREQNWDDEREFSEYFCACHRLDRRCFAMQLGYAEPPERKELLPFLRELASARNGPITGWSSGSQNFSSPSTMQRKEHLIFRRPHFSATRAEGFCAPSWSAMRRTPADKRRLHVIFASELGSPLTDNPGTTQRLSSAYAWRFAPALKSWIPFLAKCLRCIGQSAEQLPRDVIARRNPVGRVTEALDAILQEALAHGMRPYDAPRYYLKNRPSSRI